MARVLVVDDEPAVRRALERALHLEHHDVSLAEDGEQALRELGKVEMPDVVILDLNVPKIDGLGMLRAIRKDPTLAGVPIAILTSSRAPQDRMDAISSGADRFITKPVDLQSFVRIVGGGIRELIEEKK